MQQELLDTVTHLPELERLYIFTPGRSENLEGFKPIQGLRYVEMLWLNSTSYMLERNGGQPVKYRRIVYM
jgi:hypothetical protein